MYFDKTRNDVFYYGLPKTLLILGTVLVRTHIFPDGNNRELVSVWDKTTCILGPCRILLFRRCI